MKKVLTVMVLVLCASMLLAEEVVIFQGAGGRFNQFSQDFDPAAILIKYDMENEVFYFMTTGLNSIGWIFLLPDQLDGMRETLVKYCEWEATAVRNGVETQKEIPNSRIDTGVVWKWGDDFYSGKGLVVSFTFFSQTPERHQLVIETNKVPSLKNQFIDYKLDTLYLEKNQVLALIKGITGDAILAALLEHQEEKKKEAELFN